MGPEVEGGHVRAATAERRHERHPILEGPMAQDLGQCVVDGSVAAVDGQQLDVLPGELGQRLGHRPRAVGLDAHDVRVPLQELEQPGDAISASSGAEVVE